MITKHFASCKREWAGFWSTFRPGMKAVVISFKLFAGYVRVDLGCRYVGVTQHLLDGADIGVILNQVRGK